MHRSYLQGDDVVKRKPHFTIELNRDASTPLVAVTLALFIGTAAILIRLFTHL